jgi:hypothetical protein
MKYHLFLTALLLKSFFSLFAQEKQTVGKENGFEELIGTYQWKIDSSAQFNIDIEDNHLMIVIKGEGKTDLIPLGNNRFKLNHVKIETLVQFSRDSSGKIQKLTWIQSPPKSVWLKTRESSTDSLLTERSLSAFGGDYQLKNNPYKTFRIRENNGHLEAAQEKVKFEISPVDNNNFFYSLDNFRLAFEFVRDKQGRIKELHLTQKGPSDYFKIQETTSNQPVSNHQNGFTWADSLRGMITPLRSCYDVLFYDLNVTVEPQTKSISGNCIIRFRAIQSFNRIQVDLFANMKIGKILFQNHELSYTRQFNAVFVQFPEILEKGTQEQLNIFYSGKPQIPDPSQLVGGFIWFQNRNGKYWIESVCQGSGASLWWPCKDHLSDKPDSMKISITVPTGLTDISNGRLQKKTDLPGNLTRFDWYVSYPITNYDVAVNIGEYTHFSDFYIDHKDTLTLDYYTMPYNLEKAHQVISHVKPMLALYEKDFGKYPFARDGFTLVESLYPMEHQSAISFGPINNPVNSDRFNEKELTRLMWHESAHEWWGNSLTCKDMADLWIHEAFATYAEVLDYESVYGKQSALKYLKSSVPSNKEPIIGVYDVNDFRFGDMYSKGPLMLYTFQHVIDDDSLWFGLLRNLQTHFEYQSVTTDDLVDFINKVTKKDYHDFFNQYLRHSAIPELCLIIKEEGSSIQVKYKWKVDVASFNIPVKVTTSKDKFEFIHPTNNWQVASFQKMEPKDFKVDTDDFYIRVTTQSE